MKGPRALPAVAKGHGGRLVAGRDMQDEKGSVSGTLSGRAVVAAGIQGAGDREALMLLPPPEPEANRNESGPTGSATGFAGNPWPQLAAADRIGSLLTGRHSGFSAMWRWNSTSRPR